MLFIVLPYQFVQTWPSNPVKFKIFFVVSTSNIFHRSLRTMAKQSRSSSACVQGQLHDLCSQIGSAPELKQVTVRELLRRIAAVRHSMVTYGGKQLLLRLFLDENRVTLLL